MVADKEKCLRGLGGNLANTKLNKYKRRREIVNNVNKERSDSDLVIIKGFVGSNNQPLRVLIDSAAQAEIITKQGAEKLNSLIEPSDTRLVSAQGNALEVCGETQLTLNFAGKPYHTRAVVTPVLNEACDIILGISFLNKNNTSLVTQPGRSPKFVIDGNEIPVLREKSKNGLNVFTVKDQGEDIVEWVRASKPELIPPRSMGVIKIKVPYNEKFMSNLVNFHPLTDDDPLTRDESEEDFDMREGLIKVRVSGNGKCYGYIGYVNHSSISKEIKAGELLGGLSVDIESKVIDNPNINSESQYINSVKVLSKEERWIKIKDMLKDKCKTGSEEQAALIRCMKRHMSVVQLPGEPLKTTPTVQHKIDYEGPKDLFIPQYSIPFKDLEDCGIEIDRLEAEKHIRASKSAYNFPLIPVRKRNGSLRIVHDFRCLNKYTRKQRFPLPKIDDILASLKGAKYFCVLDLKSAYFQIELTEESKRFTAFRTSKGCWEYTSMPYGISNAPSTMQRLMMQVICGLPQCNVFLDDILVFGATLEECENNLENVLRRLDKHSLTISPEKCSFFKNKCSYLGHIISDEGISPDPEKVVAIKQFPRPDNLHSVRSFLGLAGYYRKFIRNYSQIAAPLHQLTKGHVRKGKRISINWGEEEEEAFCKIKEAIVEDVTLVYPDFNEPFRLTVDASDRAVGGCLSQLDKEGRDRPVTFFSKKLLPAETRYDAVSREALAIIYGLKINRQYILGRSITLLSDNQPLVWLLKSSVPSQRVARWQIILSEYDITDTLHISGKSNYVADALSRNVPEEDTVDKMLDNIATLNLVSKDNNDDIIEWDVSKIPELQNEVPLYYNIKQYLSGRKADLPKRLAAPINQFEVDDNNILFFKVKNMYQNIVYRVCLPPTYTEKALRLAHEIPVAGHGGMNATVERLKGFAYWPTMVRDTKSYVKSCKACILTKPHRGAKAPTLRNPEVKGRWERLNLDLIGPIPDSDDGNRYILSCVDVLTRYAVTAAMPDKSVATVSRAFINSVVAPYGPPKAVYSDNGKEFTGEVLREVIKVLGISQHHITVYHPQASGLVEKFNGHIVSILRAMVYEQPGTWDISLPIATLAYNTCYHSVLKETPHFLMFIRDCYLPYGSIMDTPRAWYNMDSLKHELMVRSHEVFMLAKRFIEEGKLIQDKQANKDRKLRNFQEGDRVYIKKILTSKLGSKYMGPMRVLYVKGVTVYVRDLSTLKEYQVHMDRVKSEDIITRDEAEHAREAFPIPDKDLDIECEKVAEEMSREPKDKGEEIDSLPEVKGLVQTDSRAEVNQGNTDDIEGDEGELSKEKEKNNMNKVSYPLRNRGVKCKDESWVMK